MVSLNLFSRSVKSRKRFGRGGCYGGTSGRGHKGYKARSGSVVKGFEGGQTPIYRRLPMRGFNSNKEESFEVVSLKKVLSFANSCGEVVDLTALVNVNNVNKVLVKLIGSDIDVSELDNIKKIVANLASHGVVEFLKKNNVELVLKNN